MKMEITKGKRLVDPPYVKFPLRIGKGGAELANRSSHVRGQIEQVLFTHPGERIFRPEFGAGLRTLVFEPNTSTMWQVTRKRLISSLAQALHGEVDPKTIDVNVSGDEEKLFIEVAYTLATIGFTEKQTFTIDGRF